MASNKRERQRRRRIDITEAAATLEQARGDLVALDEAAIRSDGTAAIKLISPGWGSSGFYSSEVLEAAGDDRVWPAGTQMFWDHPTVTERQDRPERSLRDLAAVLETDATWQAQGPTGPGLYAQAKVFEGFRPLLKELADHIGVSIRASAEVHTGEAEGRRGRIFSRIVEGHSVDFVTKAGRGGQVLTVLEAAGRTDLVEEARNVSDWMQSRIHLDFTTRADDMFGEGRLTKEERIALSNGIGAALDAFSQSVEELAPQLLDRDPWQQPTADTPTTTESQEDTMPLTDEIKEAVAAAVKAEVAPLQTELEETKTKLAATEAELAEAKTTGAQANEALLVESARKHVAANEKVKGLPQVTQTRIVESLSQAAEATDDGNLDTAKLDEAIKATVDTEVKYLAEATGSPVKGAGDGDTFTESADTKIDDELAEAFKGLGLSDDAAKAAAAGRGAR